MFHKPFILFTFGHVVYLLKDYEVPCSLFSGYNIRKVVEVMVEGMAILFSMSVMWTKIAG